MIVHCDTKYEVLRFELDTEAMVISPLGHKRIDRVALGKKLHQDHQQATLQEAQTLAGKLQHAHFLSDPARYMVGFNGCL